MTSQMIHQFQSYRQPKGIDNAYSFNGAFTPEECDRIIAIGDALQQEDGQAGGSVNHELRTSKIAWIDSIAPQHDTEFDEPATHWIYDRLKELAIVANDAQWQFNIDGFREKVQYTHYQFHKSMPGKFHAHLDLGAASPGRKISIVIQLTDPSEYEGGQLRIYRGTNPTTARQERGSAILFPSYMLHDVTPLTSGTRKSLVVWISGEPFR